MTTMFPMSEICANCGAVDTYQQLGSTNCFGWSDLDLRPAEMQRSTIGVVMHMCKECGYAWYDVSEAPKNKVMLAGIVSSLPRAKDLSDTYFNAGMIRLLADDDHESAFNCFLNAAWAADDAGDAAKAVKARCKALVQVHTLLKTDGENADLMLMAADIARRAGEFVIALEYIEKIEKCETDDIHRKLAAFERKLAGDEDDKCHNISEAPGIDE
ncbi:MAG: hypothetical protein MJ025_00845 [Victivallaceae bacterium]|nr:hypothetical protein [Victivallaceae bacterium]